MATLKSSHLKIFILGTIFFFSAFLSLHCYAQNGTTSTGDNKKEEDNRQPFSFTRFLGIEASVSGDYAALQLRPKEINPSYYGAVYVPQIGYRTRLGIVLDKQSEDPFVLCVEYAQAHTIDQDMKSIVSTTSVLDMGIDGTAHILYKDKKNKKYRVSIDGGIFASRCEVSFPNIEEKSKRWGAAIRCGVSFTYQLSNNMQMGGKVYQQIARYFSKTNESASFRFDYLEVTGVSLFCRF